MGGRPVVHIGQAAPMAAAASASGSGRVPGEVALVGLCAAALMAVAAVVLRRRRLLRRYRERTAQDSVPEPVSAVVERDTAVSAEPDAGGQSPLPVAADLDSVTEDLVVADSRAADVHGPDSTGNPLRASVLAGAAAAIVLIGGVGAAVFFIGGGHDTTSRASVAVGPTPGQDPAILGPGAGKAAPGKHHNADPASSHPVTGSPSASSAPGAGTPSGGARSSAGTTVQTSPGTLSGFPSQPVQLDQPGAAATVFTASISFTADGGPVSYKVSELAADDSFYTITADPASGNLAAGQQATIIVTVVLVGDGTDPGAPSVTVDPGGTVIQFKLPVIRRDQ
jgi:hypothetical protein